MLVPFLKCWAYLLFFLGFTVMWDQQYKSFGAVWLVEFQFGITCQMTSRRRWVVSICNVQNEPRTTSKSIVPSGVIIRYPCILVLLHRTEPWSMAYMGVVKITVLFRKTWLVGVASIGLFQTELMLVSTAYSPYSIISVLRRVITFS